VEKCEGLAVVRQVGAPSGCPPAGSEAVTEGVDELAEDRIAE
jgi:hypothetical protein